jgi:hypothetical protein
MRRLLMLIVLSGFFVPAFSKQDTIYPKKTYTTAETNLPVEIDGWLNEEAWNAVPWEGGFQMHEPYDDRTPTLETRFKVMYDKDHIYVAIRAFDTAPDSIVSRLTRRDEIDGDMVAFLFDSYHDLQTGFVFLISAAGSKADFYMSDDGGSEDPTWDAIWWAKTQIDDQGWTAEVKIPFTQLRFDKSSGGIWGFQVAREIFRKSETDFWQPISREAPGFVHLMGQLDGLSNIDPKKQAEIAPYVVTGSEWFEKEPENPYRAEGIKRHINAGVDAKIGITNNFTLDLTVNPDFGQVEADPSQVNLTAFETFFEEKRPFFIEGKNIFDYSLGMAGWNNLFYSRRIGRRPQHYPSMEEGEYTDIPQATKILGAAKITGKTKNGLSVGIMESVSAKETAVIRNGDERSETVEPLTNYFAGTINKEFNKGNTILGGMVTSTRRFTDEEHLNFLHTSALSGGINFEQYFADRSYNVSFSAYGSQVKGSEEALIRTQRSPVQFFQRPDAYHLTLDSSRTSLSGYGLNLSFAKTSGRFNFGGFANLNAPGLELNDLGFLTYTDEILQVFWTGYSFNEPFSIFRRIRLFANQYNLWDFGGVHALSGINVGGFTQFKNLWEASFHVDTDSEMIRNTFLRGGPSMKLPGGTSASLSVGTNPRKKLSFEVDGFMYVARENSSRRYGIDFDISYKPISNISLALYPEFSVQQSQLQYVSQQEPGEEKRYIFGSIDRNTFSMSVRMDLILTPELTIQFWGQPFIASGKYDEFKYITDPHADKFADRFRSYASNEISYDEANRYYQVNEAGSGLSYGFDDPDFNVKEFLSNLVFRWEYRPGSFLYLVWSQTRSGHDPWGHFKFGEDFLDMWDAHPTNVVMLKLSYRLGR